jgi:hypothetical protein
VGPHVAVHRRRDHDRAEVARVVAVDDVAGKSTGHRAKPMRGRGRHDDRVSRVGDHDVPDPSVREQVQQIGLDRVARERRERQGTDERVAAGVSITATSAPSARSRRSSSTAL